MVEICFDVDCVVNVLFKVSGVIGKFYVSEGDYVVCGDMLVLIKSCEFVGLKVIWFMVEMCKVLVS